MRRETIIGLLVSLGCLAWFLRGVDFVQLGTLARNMDLLAAGACLGFLALSFWFRSLRWRVMLRPLGDCPVGALYSANLIGFMANNLLPARLGELVRAYAAARLVAVPAAGVLATVVVERVLDGLTVCGLLFLALCFVDPEASAGGVDGAHLRAAGLTLLAAFLALLAGLVGLLGWPRPTIGLLARLAGRVSPRLGERLGRLLEEFAQGLGILRQTRSLPALVLLTVLVWLAMLGMNTAFLPAVGLPLTGFLGIMALVGENLAGAIPAAPGAVGTFQMAVYLTLALAGVPQDQAVAYAVLYWAVTYFALTGAGLCELWRRGMSLGGLAKRAG